MDGVISDQAQFHQHFYLLLFVGYSLKLIPTGMIYQVKGNQGKIQGNNWGRNLDSV